MKTLLILLLLIPSLSWGDKIFLNCDCKKDIQYYVDGGAFLKPSYSGKEKSCNKKIVLTLNIKEKYKDSNDRFNFLLMNEDNFWGAFSVSEQFYFSNNWINHAHPLEWRPEKNSSMWRINRMNGEFIKVIRWVSQDDGALTSKYSCKKAESKF